MCTANNARFLAYLEGTSQARALEEKAVEWSSAWLGKPTIAPVFRQLVSDVGGDPNNPARERAAWESAVHGLREQFTAEQLGFSRTALFRIAPRNLIATDADYRFAFDRRKSELSRHWQNRAELDAFWQEPVELDGHSLHARSISACDRDLGTKTSAISASIFRLGEPGRRLSRPQHLRISKAEVVGLRSSENYDDPGDGSRIATIYNGLSGRGQFVAFQ